jgi:hypothetical protein
MMPSVPAATRRTDQFWENWAFGVSVAIASRIREEFVTPRGQRRVGLSWQIDGEVQHLRDDNEQNHNFGDASHRCSYCNTARRGFLFRDYRRLRPIGSDRRPLGIRLFGSLDLPASANEGSTTVKLDPTILARIQFAFTISLYTIFPTISIGLATFLAIVEGLWFTRQASIQRWRLQNCPWGLGCDCFAF